MRKTVALLSAFALAFTLTSCGSDDNAGGNPTDAGNTGDSGNTDNTGLVAANMAELTDSIGNRTAEESSAHMVLTGDMAGQQINGEGDVRFEADNLAMTMDLTMPDGDMSMVLLENVFYVKLPEGVAPDPEKPWIKIDSEGTDPMSQAMGTLTRQMSQNADPRAALEQFKDAGEITDTREEDLNGEPTTHYTITVNVQKLVEAQADPTLKQSMQQMVESGAMKDFPVEFWAYEDGLPARILVDMPMNDPASGQAANAKMQVDYTDWGKEITVAAPPAEQVAEMPS